MFAIFDWYEKYYYKIIGIRLLYQWLVSLPCMPKTLMFQCFSLCKCDKCQTLYGGSTHRVVPTRIASSYLDQVLGSQQQQSNRKNLKLNIVVNSGPVHVNFWGAHLLPVSQTIRFLCPRRSMFSDSDIVCHYHFNHYLAALGRYYIYLILGSIILSFGGWGRDDPHYRWY